MTFGRDPFGFKCVKNGEPKPASTSNRSRPSAKSVNKDDIENVKHNGEVKGDFNVLWKQLHELFIDEKQHVREWESKMSTVLKDISILHEKMLDKIDKEYQILQGQIQSLPNASSITRSSSTSNEMMSSNRPIEIKMDHKTPNKSNENGWLHVTESDDGYIKTEMVDARSDNEDAGDESYQFIDSALALNGYNGTDNDSDDEEFTTLRQGKPKRPKKPVKREDDSDENEVEEEAKDNEIMCRTCGSKFNNKTALKIHTIENHGENNYRCKHCSFTTDEQHKFLFHKHVVHDGKKDTTCPLCDKVFTARSQTVRHLKYVHDDEDIYQQTSKALLNPPSFQDEGPWDCPKCDYKTEKKEKLTRHVKTTHDQRRDYWCEKCAFKTDSNSHLKQHVRFHHEKIFDYKCKYCYYCAITPAKLRKHQMATHDQLRTEQCHLCPSSFSSPYNLKSHIDLVHERIRLFHCDKCTYECNKKKYLRDHQAKKHGDE